MQPFCFCALPRFPPPSAKAVRPVQSVLSLFVRLRSHICLWFSKGRSWFWFGLAWVHKLCCAQTTGPSEEQEDDLWFLFYDRPSSPRRLFLPNAGSNFIGTCVERGECPAFDAISGRTLLPTPHFPKILLVLGRYTAFTFLSASLHPAPTTRGFPIL